MRLLQGFTSPPVQLNLGDLTLKRGGGTTGAAAPAKKLAGGDLGASNPLASLPSPQAASDAADADLSSGRGLLPDLEDPAAEAGAAAVPVPVEDQVVSGRGPEKQGKATMGMAKKYGAGFIWGQLNGWYKQTVFDPTASLSAERRGTISMPDIESCYGSSRNRYSMKVFLAGSHSIACQSALCKVATYISLCYMVLCVAGLASLCLPCMSDVFWKHMLVEGTIDQTVRSDIVMDTCRTGIS